MLWCLPGHFKINTVCSKVTVGWQFLIRGGSDQGSSDNYHFETYVCLQVISCMKILVLGFSLHLQERSASPTSQVSIKIKSA